MNDKKIPSPKDAESTRAAEDKSLFKDFSMSPELKTFIDMVIEEGLKMEAREDGGLDEIPSGK